MAKVFDEAVLMRAAETAARLLASGDPDVLAGRFVYPERMRAILAPVPQDEDEGKAEDS